MSFHTSERTNTPVEGDDRNYTVQNIDSDKWSFSAFDVEGDDKANDHTSMNIHGVETMEVSHDACGRINGITVLTADGPAHYVRFFR